MTYTNQWLALREELLPGQTPDCDGTDLRAWLRACRDSHACGVGEAADYVQRHGQGPRRTRGAWREFLAASGDVAEGETDGFAASYGVATEPVEPQASSPAEELLAEIR